MPNYKSQSNYGRILGFLFFFSFFPHHFWRGREALSRNWESKMTVRVGLSEGQDGPKKEKEMLH